MMTEYYSLRYIRVADTIDGRSCNGVFMYCYKIEAFKNNKQYIDFLDTHIIASVRKHYPSATIKCAEMIADGCWQKWLATLHSQSLPFHNTPSCDFRMATLEEIDAQRETKYPSSTISFYPQLTLYKESPSYPFDCIEFRYPIELTNEFSLFAKNLSDFVRNNVFTFEEACPKMKFNYRSHLPVFDSFHKAFSNRISYRWPELMHVVIDVYDENNLKPFITKANALFDKSEMNDTPYLSFCFRPTEYGIENDIIENSKLCIQLNLTIEEKYALITHEIGHFVEKLKYNVYQGNDEEIACDYYAVELGLSEFLKTALRKILDANVCDEEKNRMIQERIERL